MQEVLKGHHRYNPAVIPGTDTNSSLWFTKQPKQVGKEIRVLTNAWKSLRGIMDWAGRGTKPSLKTVLNLGKL